MSRPSSYATGLALTSVLPAESIPATAYTIDIEHTSIGFEVPHLVMSSVEGRFRRFSGNFEFDENKPLAAKGEGLSVQATVETESIDTGNEKRDKHLKSSDWL